MEKNKYYFRLADMILDSLTQFRFQRYCQIQSRLENFKNRCSEIDSCCRKLSMSLSRNWLSCTEKIRERITSSLNDFSYYTGQLKQQIDYDKTLIPAVGDIYTELEELETEFGGLACDYDQKTLSVTTDSVILEDVQLGPFEIKLFIDQIPQIASNSPYRVIALDPNPASSDESITHPHISSECLCEGDGHAAICKALKEGRLNDFFSMVISILNTYNPDSPYIALSDWEGCSCYDCGYTMSTDDSYYCEYCSRDYCSQCSTYCQACDTTICLGCAYECPSCNEPVCRNCTSVCSDCKKRFCKDCLTEEGICENCDTNRKEHENEQQEKNQTRTEIQSCGMVKTDIHA